jgi:hypothetical protein
MVREHSTQEGENERHRNRIFSINPEDTELLRLESKDITNEEEKEWLINTARVLYQEGQDLLFHLRQAEIPDCILFL